MNTITIRELRQILFAVGDQDTTVRELRHLLFAYEDQDQPVPDHF